MHAPRAVFRWSLLAGLALASAGAQAQGWRHGPPPPPPTRHEVVPGHRPGYVWAPGHYTWRRGGYVWTPGMWLRERPGWRYHPGSWDQRHGDWRWREGGWSR